ncbi:DUF6644 family protein [Novosphingobium sp. SG707]|uniref:DUF6644 family protein n=1 Tax=Novosphingobium sp. SG707 TaxID=2586996 RepID=UPI00144510DD|nr:DUF6644 family protein [Novosphingobium sp. SG707]NKI98072.1 hypothetical protein [Novosphingobium sp. SG707]
MFVQSFGDWLYATPISSTFRVTTWIIPTVQSIHILAIAVVVGSALVSELRLASVLANDEPAGNVVRRYLPWLWRALVVLLLSGVVLIVAEPARTLGNTVFWAKMALVLFAFAATVLLRRPLLREDAPPAAKAISWLLLAVWIAVIFCGRFIAYT